MINQYKAAHSRIIDNVFFVSHPIKFQAVAQALKQQTL